MKTPRRLQLPDAIELHAQRLVDGRVEFSYIERMLDRELLKHTTPAMEKIAEALRVQLHQADGELGFTGTVARRDFGDMFVSEFLLWSHFADMTMGELLGIMVATSVEPRAEPVPTAPPELLTAALLEGNVAAVSRGALLDIIDELAACLPLERLTKETVEHIDSLLHQARQFAPQKGEPAAPVGSLVTIACRGCGKTVPLAEVMANEIIGACGVRLCPLCGSGELHPAPPPQVVWTPPVEPIPMCPFCRGTKVETRDGDGPVVPVVWWCLQCDRKVLPLPFAATALSDAIDSQNAHPLTYKCQWCLRVWSADSDNEAGMSCPNCGRLGEAVPPAPQ